MSAKAQKTNAMRLLEHEKIEFQMYEYPHGKDALPGFEVAALLGRSPELVYKTLVTTGEGGYFVFVIPVAAELDLKLAAQAVGVKSLSMLKVVDLFAITGYVRGGCTPIGMKKRFPTVIDESAKDLSSMLVSGGKIGLQIELSPLALATVSGARFMRVTV